MLATAQPSGPRLGACHEPPHKSPSQSWQLRWLNSLWRSSEDLMIIALLPNRTYKNITGTPSHGYLQIAAGFPAEALPGIGGFINA